MLSVIGTEGDTLTSEVGLYAAGVARRIYSTFQALTTSQTITSPTIRLWKIMSSSSSSGSGSLEANQGSLFVGENVITSLTPVENTSMYSRI